MSNKRFEEEVTLEDGEVTKIYVKAPDNESIKAADRHRAKAWNEAFKEGVLTRKEVRSLMRERDIWNDKKETKETELTEEIIALEKKLYRGNGKNKPKVSEGRKLAIEMKEKRLDLRDLIAERISMDENTAEALAENARFDYLVCCSSFYSENDEPVFENYAEFNETSSSDLASSCASLLAKMMYNLDSDFEDQLPENKFLKQFGLINNDGNLIDPKNGDALIDSEGRIINELGQYIDDKGNRIDIHGEPVNEEGLYDLVEYDNDLAPKKSSTKKSPTKKTKTTTRRKVAKKTETTVE